VKDFLVEKNTLCFLDYADKSALVNDIGKYFVEKVTRLRDELDHSAVPDDGNTNSDSSTPVFIETFEIFATLTEDDVCMLIGNSKSTSCCLDPIPTPLLKSCIEPLIPVITKIINTSLVLLSKKLFIKKFTKQPKTWIYGMSREILVCLKRKRDVCINTIIPTPAKIRPALTPVRKR